eukprot:SM000004S14949  [mRNA]  locus=s4:438294:443211:+ [translate_table: standard]
MASALLYGSQLNAVGDIGRGLHVPYTEAGADYAAWSAVAAGGGGAGSGCAEAEGTLGEFLRLVAQPKPLEAAADGKGGAGGGGVHVRKLLGVDTPPQSPGAVSFYLPQSVLQFLATSLVADAVVVAAIQRCSRHLETILCAPKGMMPDVVTYEDNLLSLATGQVVDAKEVHIADEVIAALGRNVACFLARTFSLEEGFDGICYALWTNSDVIPSTAVDLIGQAVHSFPLLLANRSYARKGERLARQFDAILKRMPQAVVFVDDDLQQVVVNPAAAQLLQLSYFGEVDPLVVANSMHNLAERSGTRSDVQRWFMAVAGQQNSIINEEWVLKEPRRVLHVQSYPVSGSSSAVHGRLWLFEDFTAERDAQNAIVAANKGKSQFLATMSHELRTPMTGVLGMLDLLKLTPLAQEQMGLVVVMQSSAEGLMTVINNILDYCKLEANRLLLEDIDFHAGDLLDQVQSLFQFDLEEKQLKLQVQYPSKDLIALRGDPVRMKQILVNLVSNAVKFTSRGTISITWVKTSTPADLHSKLQNSTARGIWGRTYSPVVPGSPANGSPGTEPPASKPCPLSASGQLGGLVTQSASTQTMSNSSSPCSTTSSPASVSPSQSAELLRLEIPLTPAEGASIVPRVEDDSCLDKIMSPASCKDVQMSEALHPDAAIQGRVTQWCDDQVCRSRQGGVATASDRAVISRGHFKPRGLVQMEDGSIGQHSFMQDNPSPGRSPRQDPSSSPGTADMIHAADWGVTKPPRNRKRQSSQLAPNSGSTAPEFEATGKVRMDFDKEWASSAEGVEERRRREEQLQWKRQWLRQQQEQGNFECQKTWEATVEELEPEDKHVWFEISVSDTGCGIDPEHLQRLFHESEKQVGVRGTGAHLGLAISKGLLGLMGGMIEAESEVEVGSTFRVTVPLALAEEPEKVTGPAESALDKAPLTSKELRAKSPRPVPLGEDGQLRVLVAEDNKVTLVGNGQLALEAVQRESFDIVLMDVQMPVLDGLSATKLIRQLSGPAKSIPIYALTADVLTVEIEEVGLSGYLSKLIVWENISEVVDKILAEK